MKKALFLLAAMLVFMGQGVKAQTEPMSVTTDNPDVKVRVTRCVAAGSTVYIDMTIVNETGKDFEVYAVARGNGCNTLIYDDEGNEYDSERTQIRFGRDDFESGHIYKNIISDVPTKFTIKVSDVPRHTEYFSLVKPFMDCGQAPFQIKLRNVPITRD